MDVLFGESGHEIDSVELVWNAELQRYVAVIVHDEKCRGCLSPTVGREGASGTS
jgi:hypothetical protein